MAETFAFEDSETVEDKFGTFEENEWSKLIKARLKEGYVEGKYMGGESTVQTGFDHGYEKGFEISYPISILKGLLAANELLQKDSNPDSLRRLKDVKQLLNEFEKKSMLFMKRDENQPDVSSDSAIENTDASAKENLNGDSSEVGGVSSCEVNEINKELNVLKKEVQMLLKDCNQSHIFEQIAHHFEKWNLSLAKNACNDSSHSTADPPTIQEQC